MITAELGSVKVGDGKPVAVMGAVNLGGESFYQGSIATTPADAAQRAARMVREGAAIIDIGGMGTGPRAAPISPAEEQRRLVPAVRSVARAVDVPISADTQRADVAEAAIDAGAVIINDISGLKADPRMAEVLAKQGCSAIVMSARKGPGDVYNVADINRALKSSLKVCRDHGLPARKVVVDPGIGFWPARLALLGPRANAEVKGRGYSLATQLDLRILAKLKEIRVGRPICISASRKSFLGSVLKLTNPEDRLQGSLATAAIAVVNGAHVIRSHDPLETTQAVRIAEEVRDSG